MSKRTANSLFIDSSIPRLYQQLLTGIEGYQELGNRIIKQIKAACAFRQVERVRELSVMLTNFPVKEYQLIGQYYIVWCDGRESKYNAESLAKIIEQTSIYKTKAMLSLAAFEIYQGKAESSLYYYTEALKTSPSISDYIVLSRSVAALKSVEGFHESALRDLENLLPIIQHAEPQVYYDFLNSYAVELGEVGRLSEARNVMRVVIASPFAPYYPEWQGTANDLRGNSRSFVGFKLSAYIPRKVLPMPEREHEAEPKQESKPARVLNLQKWKQKMAKKKDKEPEPDNIKDMLIWIMNAFTKDETSDYQRYEIYKAVRKVMTEKLDPDDTEGA